MLRSQAGRWLGKAGRWLGKAGRWLGEAGRWLGKAGGCALLFSTRGDSVDIWEFEEFWKFEILAKHVGI